MMLLCHTGCGPASYPLWYFVDKYKGVRANMHRLWLIKSAANGIRNINGNARNMLCRSWTILER